MHWTEPSLLSTLAFITIVTAVLVMLRLALRHAAPDQARAVMTGVFLWMAVTAALAGSGVLEARLPVSVFGFMGVSGLLAVGLALSPVGRRLAAGVPLAALVGFHAFRLPLEIVLHQLYGEGVIPVTMTWEGRNLDVLSGILALLAVPALRAQALERWHKGIAWLVNLVGFGLLLNVGYTAALSSPVPFRRFMDDPPLQLAFHVPWVWIVPVCVAGALGGHVVAFRALLKRS